jgi:hypothetical protein
MWGRPSLRFLQRGYEDAAWARFVRQRRWVSAAWSVAIRSLVSRGVLRWLRGWDEIAGDGLGRLVGFEPTTSAATERRSATEL